MPSPTSPAAGRPRRPARTPRPLNLEALEDRTAPAVTSLYVVSQGATAPGSFLKEYTTSGVLVRSTAIPIAGGTEYARDLALTGKQLRVYNGTFDPHLSTYDGTTGAWANTDGPAGWSTVNNSSYGGLAVLGGFAFATDMTTFSEPADEAKGIVRFDLSDGSSTRFADDTEPIDVAAGLDGKVYALDAFRTIRVYDPATLGLLNTVVLPAQVVPVNAFGPVTQDYRAIAVDQNGLIYAADWNAYVTRFDATGVAQISRRLPTAVGEGQGPPVANLTDIDFVSAPLPYDGSNLAVGSTNGVVALVNSLYLFANGSFSAGVGPAFVTTGPALTEVSISDAGAVTEGPAGTTTTVTFTVSLSSPVAQSVIVRWSTSGGSSPSATAGSDYQSVTGATITFAPGETSKQITVTVIGDNNDEFNENFRVNLAANPTGAVLAKSIGTASITDDDDPPQTATALAGSAGDARDSDGNGVFETFTPTTGQLVPWHYTSSYEVRSVLEFDTSGIDRPAFPIATLDLYIDTRYVVATPVRVIGYTGDGTAALGDATVTGTQLGVFTPSTTGWQRITLDRAAVEQLLGGSNVLGIVLKVDTGSLLYFSGTGSPRPPRLTFWTSEPPVVPVINGTGYSVTEGNPGQPDRAVRFYVSLNQATTAPVTVDYQTSNETATAGSDYQAMSGTLTFAPGETLKAVDVPVVLDTIYEPDETLRLNLSNPTIASFNTLSPYGTIYNDDAIPFASLNTSAVSVTEGSPYASTPVTFTVTLSNVSGQTITVQYATADGTATAGADYTAASGTLTFNPGETSKTITVYVNGDTVDEPNETFALNLIGGQNANFSTPYSATITILDDEPAPGLSVSSPTATEGGSLAFQVTLSNPSSQTVTVQYATANGTATAGSDYTAAGGTLTFAPGETSKTVSVATLEDNIDEPAETVLLQLSNPTNASIQTGTGTGTIADNDPTPTPAVSSPSAVEANGQLVFAITLSNPSSQPISLSYSTVDVTATAGSDYAATSGTLVFAPGETSKSVAVPVTNDTLDEPNETFRLQIPYLGTTWQGTGTIIDDDPPPTLNVGPASVVEGDAGTTTLLFPVTLSGPTYQTVSAGYSTADGTATAGSDYTAAAGNVVFAPGETSKTVAVTVSGDTLLEPDETLTLIVGTPVNAWLGAGSAVGTILTDDFAPVANAGPDQSADENTVVTFDGTGSSDADGDPLTFAWDFGDGTTGSGPQPTHKFPDDGVFTVTLTVSDGQGGVSTDTMSVTVQNVAPTAVVTGPTAAVRGQDRTFTLTASDPSPVDQAAPFGYRIDWGDGSPNTTTSGPAGGATASHTFTASGSYTVRAYTTDKDGSEGPAGTLVVTVAAVALQGGDLVIGGTTGADTIRLAPANTIDGIRVTINNQDQGAFTPTGQVVVYAQAGNDAVSFGTLKVGNKTYRVDQPLLLFGGDGNDALDAGESAGPAVVLGGAGGDTITGGNGRAILIGGLGADTLEGGSGDDVLIGGTTDLDGDLAALAAVRAEWAGGSSYSDRIRHLLGTLGGGLNGAYYLSPGTVNDDGAVDSLRGNGGTDWFFAAPGDQVKDKKGNETLTNI
jgi:hypothetical protein